MRNEGKLDRLTVRNWFGQVLDGVAAAHRAGVMHRDLKPDNILVSAVENGAARLCVLDFGLAKIAERETHAARSISVTRPGTIMGTIGYMPPEQLRGDSVDASGDLFAIGVMIYEALNGRKPFVENSYHELLAAMSRKETFEAASELPLQTFFAQALAPGPGQRFTSAAEMKLALQKMISELTELS